MKKYFIYFCLCLLFVFQNALAKTLIPENPFGSSVYLFDADMDPNQINNRILQIYNQQQFNEFGEQRYVFMFMPGQYGQTVPIDVRTGYYTQVLGLGRTPNDVVIKGAVRTQDRPGGPGATMTFWRSAENLSIIPTLGSLTDPNIPKDQNVWACSQGAPLRRIRIMNGSLRLWDVSWSSGGLLADSRVDKTVFSGTQQQWLTRNSTFSNWNGSNWNIVFVGTLGTIPGGNWPNPPYTIVDKTPLIKEKPYLFFDNATNQFMVNIRTRRRNVAGTDWHIAGTRIPLSSFYIAKPGVTAAQINLAIQSGKHLFFIPGIYHLNDTIKITNRNTIVYGLGYPTLISDTGKPVMMISDVEGVQVAGPFLIDAGPTSAPTLFQVGEDVNSKTHIDPVFIYDLFCRVGGVNHPSTATSCLTINSNDVVVDYPWLWRADHGANVGWNNNKADTGVIVNGQNVIIYNLMAEHFQKYQVLWNGDNGRTYEFQSEPPYDVPNQQAWMDGNINGYAAYKIASNVINHQVWALGIYTNFQNSVWMDSAISAPQNAGVKLLHMIGFWLNGNGNSGFRHMVNSVGCGVTQGGGRLCHFAQWP